MRSSWYVCGISILRISSWDLELTQPFEILPQIFLVLAISYVTIKHDILHKKQYLNGKFIYVLVALSALEKNYWKDHTLYTRFSSFLGKISSPLKNV